MRDIIHYKLALGPLSYPTNRFVISRQLSRIFSFRKEALAQRFGRMN